MSLLSLPHPVPPTQAIVAVTLNCNARCVMCDIWKNKIRHELAPGEFAALPGSLRGINITGGEPFLREDLPEILRVMRQACPKARLLISTNGFVQRRADTVRQILRDIPDLAIRISLDGIGATHDRVRGLTGAFDRALAFLEEVRALGVRDLGFNLTLLEDNFDQLPAVYQLCQSLGIELGVTVATDAVHYFGAHKQQLRPADQAHLGECLEAVADMEYRHLQPRRWFRGWFEKGLLDYIARGQRPLPCDAGRGFFYLDSLGNVYGCHVRPGILGNIREQTFSEIWSGPQAQHVRDELHGCNACWMVCTAKSAVYSHWKQVSGQMLVGKLKAHLPLAKSTPRWRPLPR